MFKNKRHIFSDNSLIETSCYLMIAQGQSTPSLAVEVVTKNIGTKDLTSVFEKCLCEL